MNETFPLVEFTHDLGKPRTANPYFEGKKKREFAEWFYQHEGEIACRSDDLSDEQKAELTRRLDGITENPEILVPFSTKRFDAMTQEFADERKRT